MKAYLYGAALITMASLPAHAANEFQSAGDLVEANGRDPPLVLRLYVRGIGDGFAAYGAMLETQGGHPVYCPPNNVGIVDAQYIAIMKGFLQKVPSAKSQLPAAVLLFALLDAFPCKGQ